MHRRSDLCLVLSQQCAEAASCMREQKTRDLFAHTALIWACCADDRLLLERLRASVDPDRETIGTTLEPIVN